MSRQVILTLGHCPSRVWVQSIRAIRRTRTTTIPHYFLYHYYPIHQAANRRDLVAICAEYGISVLYPDRNLGLHGGLNFMVKELGLTSGDTVITVDPDTHPTRSGWDDALLKVVNSFPSEYGWAALTNTSTPSELAARPGQYVDRNIRGVNIHEMQGPCVVSISAWQMTWVLSAGGFHEPCQFYGHIESAMYPDLIRANKKLAILTDYAEDDSIKGAQHVVYAEWKYEHAFKGYVKNFGEFVAERYPDLN